MVSIWPWKGDDASPASFEKTLSTVSKKIAATQLQLDKLRSSSRRVKVLWVLYLSFAYLVYAIVLVLVVGWQSLGPWEWTGLAGGPVLIYLIRTITNAYFTFRIDSLEARLKDQQSERGKTIQKLKEATRYDSTQELLEKYGGEKPKPKRTKSAQMGEDHEDPAQKGAVKRSGRQNTGPGPAGQPGRTNAPPPPTANIQIHNSPAGALPHPRPQSLHRPSPIPPRGSDFGAEFAPNASDLSPSYTQYDYSAGPPRWYDRILDLMLGEDETAPKNRIVLICKNCHLVNGQAPPGTKSLAEIGQWKCMSCGIMNGEMDEGKKIMREVLGQEQADATDIGEESERGASSDMTGGEATEEEPEPEPVKVPTRRQPGRPSKNRSKAVP